jgi:hypothetical protein
MWNSIKILYDYSIYTVKDLISKKDFMRVKKYIFVADWYFQ